MTALEQRRAGLVVEREHADGCHSRLVFASAIKLDYLGRANGTTTQWARFYCPDCFAKFLVREADMLGVFLLGHGRRRNGRPS